MLLKEENENLLTEYIYDNLGRIKSIKESNNVFKNYEYDLNRNRINFKLFVNDQLKINNRYEYDDANRLLKVLNHGSIKVEYSYDEDGNRISMINGNGIYTDYKYNNENLLLNLTSKKYNVLLSEHHYSYFLNGYQEKKVDHIGRTSSYTYDKSGQLIEEQEIYEDSTMIKQYVYNNLSNRTQMTTDTNGEKEIVSYEYDNKNRLIRESISNASTSERELQVYLYDANRNQIFKSRSAFLQKGLVEDRGIRMCLISTDVKEEMDYSDFNSQLSGIEKESSGNKVGKVNLSLIGKDSNPIASSFETGFYTYNGLIMCRV